MRVLFLSTWFPYPFDNGSKLRVYYLLRSLAQQHEVTLLSFAFATAQPDEPGKLRDWCRNIQIVPTDPFVVNKAGSLRTFLSIRPVASRPVPAMSQLIYDALHSRPYDVVIASTGMMIDYALTAPPGTAKVLEEHNSMTRWARDRFQESKNTTQRARRWLSWRKGCSYESRTYPRFDLITMVSEVDRRATMGAVKKERLRVEVVPNGVDCEHNQPGLAESQPNHLVFNGSLTYSANYDAMQNFLAEIYPQIKAALPNTVLTITGSTTGADLSKLALDNSVRLTGYVDDVRIPVAEAAVAIAPIRQGGGTRLKILEAMALGTPVVATSKAAESLNVQDGEHLLIADASQQFADSVVRLLNNRTLSHRLQQAARRRVIEQYDWQQIGQKFVRLIENSVTRLC
ncbi:MAG: glycosyltransferase [Caldilineaceae bacterium]|nr:glycosyltransferase [Caldilineaceae bacterium]